MAKGETIEIDLKFSGDVVEQIRQIVREEVQSESAKILRQAERERIESLGA